MKDLKTNAFISKEEWAERTFQKMTMQDCINMWNEATINEGCKFLSMHKMEDEQEWNNLSQFLGAWDLIHVVLHSGDEFNDSDLWFFYDDDLGIIRSFSTKQELIEKIGKGFFIDRIMEQKMTIFEYGRIWEVIDDHIFREGDWFVGDFADGELYMNNQDGYMVLFTGKRTLKADI